MKKIATMTLLAAIVMISVNQVSGFTTSNQIRVHEDSKTESFKVYGNCGMCRKTIDAAVNEMKGVKSASWNVETKIIEVTYDGEKVSLKEIKQEIAKAGYDTKEFKATDKAYASLPGCCQYDRVSKE